MLAKIGNFLGLRDAGHAPPRQAESRSDRDFGDFVAAARTAKGHERDGSAASGPGGSDVAQVEESAAAQVDDADVAQQTEAGAEDALACAVPVAGSAKEDASAGPIAKVSASPEDKVVEAGLGMARATATPETGARMDGATDDLAGARPAVAASLEMATIPRGQRGSESLGAAATMVATQAPETGRAGAQIGGAKQPAAATSVRIEPPAIPAGAAKSAPVAPDTAQSATQPLAVAVRGQASAATATSDEFALHRASLQAEKLAQLVSVGGDSGRVDSKAPNGVVQQSVPGAIGPVDGTGPSRKVETLIRNADPASDLGLRALESGSANARAVAAMTAPAAPTVSTLAPQAVAAAGVTHPSILEAADDADTPDFATQGAAGELRTGSTYAAIGAQPSRADAAAVVRQISESMPRTGNGTIEIRLSPDELGHVRLQMVPGESGMMVHIQAERAETLDLLRRHVDQLARDLAESGHDASGFTFAEGRDGQGRGSEPGREGASGADLSSSTTSQTGGEADAAPGTLRADGGLDITI